MTRHEFVGSFLVLKGQKMLFFLLNLDSLELIVLLASHLYCKYQVCQVLYRWRALLLLSNHPFRLQVPMLEFALCSIFLLGAWNGKGWNRPFLWRNFCFFRWALNELWASFSLDRLILLIGQFWLIIFGFCIGYLFRGT